MRSFIPITDWKHMPTRVILDTDIGDDIDDAFCLALMCASPEIELIGVTTVFGNVHARGRQARTILSLAGDKFRSVPVAVGCSRTMASRPRVGGAADAELPPNQDAAAFPEDRLPPASPLHGVEFLIRTLMDGDGDIIPVTIGAMTNLAAALTMERRLLKKIPRIIAMAGEFRKPMAEWNILCDPEAAHLVFASGIPMTVIPWEIGYQVQLTEPEVQTLYAAARPSAKNLADAVKAWRGRGGAMPSLYDPMTAATWVNPKLCQWKRGTVSVELAGRDTYGYSPFVESADGPHTVAWDADRAASVKFVLDRVLAL
jgi:purine nucleosidase